MTERKRPLVAPEFIEFMAKAVQIAQQKAASGDKGAARRAGEMARGVVELLSPAEKTMRKEKT